MKISPHLYSVPAQACRSERLQGAAHPDSGGESLDSCLSCAANLYVNVGM